MERERWTEIKSLRFNFSKGHLASRNKNCCLENPNCIQIPQVIMMLSNIYTSFVDVSLLTPEVHGTLGVKGLLLFLLPLLLSSFFLFSFKKTFY